MWIGTVTKPCKASRRSFWFDIFDTPSHLRARIYLVQEQQNVHDHSAVCISLPREGTSNHAKIIHRGDCHRQQPKAVRECPSYSFWYVDTDDDSDRRSGVASIGNTEAEYINVSLRRHDNKRKKLICTIYLTILWHKARLLFHEMMILFHEMIS